MRHVSRDVALPVLRDAIEVVLNNPEASGSAIYDAIEARDPSIRKQSDIEDYDLACLYSFAEYFFYCREHGDEEYGPGIPMKVAEEALREAVQQLRTEKPRLPALITDRRGQPLED